MVKTFCTSGENEALKGAVHGLGGVLAASMAANAIVYSLAIVWEVKQTVHHLERCEAATPETTQAA